VSHRTITTAVSLIALGPLGLAAQTTPDAHVHIGHVLSEFGAAPDGMGLMPLALAEAEIAAEHARLAAGGDPTNIDPMIQHARHVLNALDPAEFEMGPGLGFGLKPAIEGVSRHIGLAAAAEGASDNVRLHAEHVSAAANAVSARVDEAILLARQVLASGVYTDAYPLVRELRDLCAQLLEDELDQVRQHMELMAEGEGLS
jgi:alkylation response protein AidB-like acyl-CoA dehydrogenase